jgi:peptidoglycan hydrolase-like protein with peptidoglycan-binding domain
MSSPEIFVLQQFLNVSRTGYFGPITQKAVQSFQGQYNLASPGQPGYGQVNASTRTKLNELYKAQKTTAATATTATTITMTLKYGMTHAQVKTLQTILAKDKSIYPEAQITGYFGQLTRKAVQRFQAKYNIVSSGNESTTGYGMVGPLTRKKLKEVGLP